MFDKDDLEKIEKIAEKIQGTMQGKHLLINVVGEFIPARAAFPEPPGIEPEKDDKYEPTEHFFKDSVLRIISSKSIETVWQHEKGSVIRLIGGFGMAENLIIKEKLNYIAVQCDWDVK